jgi:type IV pilus assembly protein PilB
VRLRKSTTLVAERPEAPENGRSAKPVPQPVRPDGWQPLGELLMERKAVSSQQVSEALLQQSASGKRVGMLLVELGAINERDLAEALAEQLSLALVDLGMETPDPDAVMLVPESMARAHMCIPMMRTQDAVIVAVADPGEVLLQQLTHHIGLAVTLVVAPASEIRYAIDNSYRSLEGIDQFVAAFEKTSNARKAVALTSESAQDDAPVVQVVNKIISQALRDRASDVHVEPQDSRLRIRFRIDGALHDVLALPEAMGPALVSRLKIMAGMNIVERRRPQDGQIAMDVDGRSVDIRVATTGVIWGEKVVLRILDKSRRSTSSATSACRRTPTRRSQAGARARSAWCCAPARPARARRPRSTRR